MEGGSSSSSKHFILVHGLCHGAWCWYKVVTMLRSEGHRVTPLDLAASGVHPARIDEVHSFEEYSQPLLDVVAAAPVGERLVLVGHSFGGLSLSLAMERFPEKIAAAVFIVAAMPCVGKHIGITTELMRERSPKDLIAMEDSGVELMHYMIALSPGTEVEEIPGADHAIMCSRPRELSDLLAKIGSKYD